MFNSYRIKDWLSWAAVRAHMCTFAACVTLNSLWRAPRGGLRFGGAPYALALSAALSVVALPAVLMQLAVGQLSQQDPVGVWRAVPFFKGVGYLRLLISYLASVYSVVYVALSAAYFLYASSNSIPFSECYSNDTEIMLLDAPTCLNATFMGPVAEQPEYYIAVSLVVIALWVAFPFVLYSPVKQMKRIFYALSPIVVLLAVIVLSVLGEKSSFWTLQRSGDWRTYLQPHVWHSAIVQALWASQVAGGYLISVGDTVYSNTNVQWTSLAVVGSNIVASWIGIMFWFGISDHGTKDSGPLAVLVQTYTLAIDDDISLAWPLLIFAMLFLSGFITMLMLLYPVYDRFRRTGGPRWRLLCVASSVLGAVAALVLLAGRLPALTVLDDVAVPFLVSLVTVLEMAAFVYIYGCKLLVEDVEFLTGNELSKYWVWGWHAAPIIILIFTIWWLVDLVTNAAGWTEPPWEASTLIFTFGTSLITFTVFALVSVSRQVQYDIISKFKSSFKPSRHWGPRDPITHYYWLARREEVDRGNVPRTRYQRRFLGQFSGSPSFLNVSVIERSPSKELQLAPDVTRRTNSDDWVYTGYRKKYLEDTFKMYLGSMKRSKSLDWTVPNYSYQCRDPHPLVDSEVSHYVTPDESSTSIPEETDKTQVTNNNNVNK